MFNFNNVTRTGNRKYKAPGGIRKHKKTAEAPECTRRHQKATASHTRLQKAPEGISRPKNTRKNPMAPEGTIKHQAAPGGPGGLQETSRGYKLGCQPADFATQVHGTPAMLRFL